MSVPGTTDRTRPRLPDPAGFVGWQQPRRTPTGRWTGPPKFGGRFVPDPPEEQLAAIVAELDERTERLDERIKRLEQVLEMAAHRADDEALWYALSEHGFDLGPWQR